MSLRILPTQGQTPDAFYGPVFSKVLILPPQNVTGEAAPPTDIFVELHEETVGVFGNLIYDEDGVGSTGGVRVTED